MHPSGAHLGAAPASPPAQGVCAPGDVPFALPSFELQEPGPGVSGTEGTLLSVASPLPVPPSGAGPKDPQPRLRRSAGRGRPRPQVPGKWPPDATVPSFPGGGRAGAAGVGAACPVSSPGGGGLGCPFPSRRPSLPGPEHAAGADRDPVAQEHQGAGRARLGHAGVRARARPEPAGTRRPAPLTLRPVPRRPPRIPGPVQPPAVPDGRLSAASSASSLASVG